jgi:hypothetical protein
LKKRTNNLNIKKPALNSLESLNQKFKKKINDIQKKNQKITNYLNTNKEISNGKILSSHN